MDDGDADRATLASIETAILDAVGRCDAVDAPAVLFLLRRYRTSPRDDLADALGSALAAALGVADAGSPRDRSARLMLFLEAIPLSSDERLPARAAELVASLASEWSASSDIAELAASIDACLSAADLPEGRATAAAGIEALEGLIGRAYEPGAGLIGAGGTGRGVDQVCTASALLTAYELSGRLPYPMLAEELMQIYRRGDGVDFDVDCRAARVLCRLAALHEDADYRSRAVTAPDADYRGDARTLLRAHEAAARARGASAAIYGLALVELKSADSYAD